MPQFHETLQGKKFFEAQLPALIKAIEKLGNQKEVAATKPTAATATATFSDTDNYPFAKVWSRQDIILHIREPGWNFPTEKEVNEIIETILTSHDANTGINWVTIENAVRKVLQ